jgi:hypothetical protein
LARFSEAFWVVQLGELRTLGAFSSLAELTSLAAKRKGKLYEPVRLYLEVSSNFRAIFVSAGMAKTSWVRFSAVVGGSSRKGTGLSNSAAGLQYRTGISNLIHLSQFFRLKQ